MFSGIVEGMGEVVGLEREGTNVTFTLRCPFADELHIDQSLAHNGVCLTIVALGDDNTYKVTAIDETLRRSNLGDLREGDRVNLERSMPVGGRLDGHIVQGHVDTTAECIDVKEEDGSWRYTFRHIFEPELARKGYMTVDKGSVTVNGVSLTVCDPTNDTFSVAIIPYTHDHTNFADIRIGSKVNLEFDILGKYLARLASI
ncbi:MAG: riboflavin synthase [Bacteroides sp.]|nr:riboflavin synthase [Bacteroides sp.]